MPEQILEERLYGEMLTALVAAEDGSWVERRSGADAAEVAGALAAYVA